MMNHSFILKMGLTIFLMFGLLTGLWSTATVTKKNAELSELTQYIEKARKRHQVPGMAVGIVYADKIVLTKGFGVLNHQGKDPVDADTLFAIASNSKAFGAAALSILVDEKKISWDDKVQHHLPYFKLYDPYVSANMTIRDLLCHRSGLRTFGGDLLWYETKYTSEEIIRKARFLEPSFEFRSGFGYSNLMYIAAGEVAAAVAGKSWNEFIRERIFAPLGMNRSNIGSSRLKGTSNVATPHYITPAGKTVTVPYSFSDHTGAAAAINSSASDMTKWIKMLLNGGKIGDRPLLSEKGLEEMWASHNPTKVGRRFKRLSPTTHFRSYGLGWGMFDYHGRKILTHSGALDGMISQVALVPESGLGLVVLTNSINRLPGKVMKTIIDKYLGLPDRDWCEVNQPAKTNRKDSKLKKRSKRRKKLKQKISLAQYAGIYGGPMYGDAEISLVKGKLILNLIPSPVFISDLSHLHYDTFRVKLRNKFSFIPSGEGTAQFIRDKHGKIVEFKLDIPNNDFHFSELEFKRKK